jgi:hypothetical protein
MEQSNDVAQLFAALAEAQGDIEDAEQTASATSESGDSYTYAPLSAVLACIRTAFSRRGLFITQPVRVSRHVAPDAGNSYAEVEVDTIVGHTSGQWIKETLALRLHDDSAQAIGTLISYGRRYGASAAAGIASEKDTDGKRARTANDSSFTHAPQIPAAQTPPTAPTAEQEAATAGYVAQIAGADSVGAVSEIYTRAYGEVRAFGFQALLNQVIAAKGERVAELQQPSTRKGKR